MASSKEIRRRIKSVKNIGQITKAMELVSAAKMRRAQIQALASRPYAKLSSSLLENLMAKVETNDHPILNRVLPDRQTDSGKSLVILVSPSRGLAGALNSNLVSKAVEIIRQEGRENVDFLTIGKKGEDMVRRMKLNVIADFEQKERGFTLLDARPIAQIAIDEYLANHYSKVFITFTDFVSTLVQKPSILQLLPLTHTKEADTEEYLFEPSADDVMESLVHRVIEFAVYQSIVEAQASEHSARMVAMRNANEAAVELIDELQLSYNQARQSGITRELSEISAAKLAMEG